MIGLTSLITRNPPTPPKLNRRRALFVLTKIDEILAWEQRKDEERDTKFGEFSFQSYPSAQTDGTGVAGRT